MLLLDPGHRQEPGQLGEEAIHSIKSEEVQGKQVFCQMKECIEVVLAVVPEPWAKQIGVHLGRVAGGAAAINSGHSLQWHRQDGPRF